MSNIVNANTKLGELYKDTELEFLAPILYYSWIKNSPHLADATIMDMYPEVWDNDETIKDLNLIYDMYKEGSFIPYFINQQKPNVCLMHLKQKKTTKFAIVIAGGGYSSVATAVEALPVGMHLYEKKGMNVFLLNYSIYPDSKLMSPMDDLACAINYIQNHLKELNVVMDDYMVIGFSAGGHLVASWGTNNHGYRNYKLPKPGLIGLAYPVITFTTNTHGGTKTCSIGENPSQQLIDEYSCEKHVDKEYPKTYLWACERDNTVPFESNSLAFSHVLEQNNIPFMFKTINDTAHGWGLGNSKPIKGWVDELFDFWLRK